MFRGINNIMWNILISILNARNVPHKIVIDMNNVMCIGVIPNTCNQDQRRVGVWLGK